MSLASANLKNNAEVRDKISMHAYISGLKFIDFWHCNSTGVYSGVVASGNGNDADAANINTTFHRGLAPTNRDGVVTFLTTYPGHYTDRAHHIHVLGTHNGKVLANHTYAGGMASHVGQIFFDQDLSAEVEATSDYVVNTQPLTTNAEDWIFHESVVSGFDPVVEYALLGDSVKDGIFSWISIGIDATVSETVQAASTLTANGGVAHPAMTFAGPRPTVAAPSPAPVAARN